MKLLLAIYVGNVFSLLVYDNDMRNFMKRYEYDYRISCTVQCTFSLPGKSSFLQSDAAELRILVLSSLQRQQTSREHSHKNEIMHLY